MSNLRPYLLPMALLLATGANAFATTNASSKYQTLTPSTTWAAQTGNNTSAANSFAGCEVSTVTSGQCVNNGDQAASNVSKVNIHSLLAPSQQNAKIYTTYIPYWGGGSHPNIGYSSQDPAQVAREVADLTSRGFDGVLVDWYGPGSWEEGATEVLKPALEAQSQLTFVLMIDVGAIKWHSCYPHCSATQALMNTIAFARQQGYFSSPAAMRSNGKVLVTQFGLEAYPIIWSRITAANPDLEWIFENAGAFTNGTTSGAYGWLSPKNPMQNGYEGLDYTQYFEQIAGYNPSKRNWASAWKGFNDIVASWAPPGGRHIQQLCGKTWVDSWAAVRAYTGRLDSVQAVTWHDYEEGTEIQSGIDNCLTLSASLSGSVLSWSVNDSSTLDHYVVYGSTDGQNLAVLDQLAIGTNSLDLSQFNLAPGNYQVFVQAVGLPSIVNHISSAITYAVKAAASVAPTVAITAPTNNFPDAGPYTNLNATASSANGAITQYTVAVDGATYKSVGGAPTMQLWTPTAMGKHVLSVTAVDAKGMTATTSITITRTY